MVILALGWVAACWNFRPVAVRRRAPEASPGISPRLAARD
jgi:hypothetical protein